MQVSLNDLVQLLAARVGEPWNADLQEQMKVVLNYKRAQFFKRLLDQHPEQRRYFFKDFNAELAKADKSECPIEVDCYVMKTVMEIPLPLRTDLLFDFVGSSDKTQAYGYATPDQIAQYIKYNKYTSTTPKYFYTNNRIYIFNDQNIKNITIRGIYPDPRQLHEFQCNGTVCYTDNDQYDIPYDLINDMIRDTLQTELRNEFPQSLKEPKEDTKLNDENNRA
jgi:hypothetical protein